MGGLQLSKIAPQLLGDPRILPQVDDPLAAVPAEAQFEERASSATIFDGHEPLSPQLIVVARRKPQIDQAPRPRAVCGPTRNAAGVFRGELVCC